MLSGCTLKNAFDKGETSMGLWQCLPGANVSRALARTPGVDWVMVDCEHGNMDGALDAGAHGILVPLLRSAEDAKKIVAAAKFPPWGQRGFGSPFAMERFSPIPSMTEYLQHANESLLTMVQIETQEALDAVDEIARVPGVDVLMIGPFDLGNNIGHPILDGVIKPELQQAMDRILAATKKAGKKAGFFATSPEQARESAEKGFDMISVALDVTHLQASLALSLSVAKGSSAPKTGGGYGA
ncbi:hypothetical protein DL768_004407 [Monosporascus sp. mg162]|nr:hypothetical protein DL768_004407 [Monosporascus sp. mg162]